MPSAMYSRQEARQHVQLTCQRITRLTDFIDPATVSVRRSLRSLLAQSATYLRVNVGLHVA